MITEDGYDLVSGWKQKRYDPLSKTIPTKLFNATARKVSGIKNLHDFNCGLKAYRKDVIKNIEVYGEMHRYIPYLAKNAGFKKIGEKVVRHQHGNWQDKIRRVESFLQRIPGLDILWFLSTFGIQAYALLWHIGFADVLRRIRCRHYCRRQQAVLHESRDALPPCDRFSLFLPVTDIHDYRHAVICGRFSRRADIPQCTRTQ
mgnify:CR=1 FL=1